MESVQILLKEEVFKFQVKACSDAYLLYKQTKAADEFSYHIGLGYGRKTVIWKQPPDPVTKEFMTPDEGLLKCEEFVSYWVRWEGAKFGIGLDGAQPFVEWKDPKPFTIGAVSLATPHPKQKVTWKLDTQSIGTLRVDTGEDYSYEQSWVSAIGRSAIVLQVKACRDVHVLLSDKEGVPGNGYEVAIGMSDNMKTAIREVKFGPNMINVDTPDILSCKDTRAFWFRWSHHKLSMGRGTKLGNRTLINYGKEDHPMEIRSLGLSTGWGATGRWLFNMAETVMYPS
ncbi:hypothetical protein CAPTEDRAFT_225278 [Capitella teleta]|uniref:Farnesoic acid O-methyl transferase domain-containing protein n=1 Tax=Capitella teleta TaxID=283909 RepID=R7TXW3_CAPTE|nr:hypothetical protein CAPTEDRAFT_225278 [Capitella teleta]|eukprot:ELT98457.1 hypothetical protein CAPTEDRAFT_225278 [Capitella teleta]